MRLCDRCGSKLAPYHPRTRVGEEMLCDACKKAPAGVSAGGVISEASVREEHPLSHEHLSGDDESMRAHYVSHHWDPTTQDLEIPEHDWHGAAHAGPRQSHTHRKARPKENA